jgi:hypothetical protein
MAKPVEYTKPNPPDLKKTELPLKNETIPVSVPVFAFANCSHLFAASAFKDQRNDVVVPPPPPPRVLPSPTNNKTPKKLVDSGQIVFHDCLSLSCVWKLLCFVLTFRCFVNLGFVWIVMFSFCLFLALLSDVLFRN